MQTLNLAMCWPDGPPDRAAPLFRALRSNTTLHTINLAGWGWSRSPVARAHLVSSLRINRSLRALRGNWTDPDVAALLAFNEALLQPPPESATRQRALLALQAAQIGKADCVIELLGREAEPSCVDVDDRLAHSYILEDDPPNEAALAECYRRHFRFDHRTQELVSSSPARLKSLVRALLLLAVPDVQLSRSGSLSRAGGNVLHGVANAALDGSLCPRLAADIFCELSVTCRPLGVEVDAEGCTAGQVAARCALQLPWL